MYETLIAALAGLLVTAIGWIVTKVKLATKNKIVLALVAAIERLDDKEIKQLVEKLAEKSGVREKLDAILEKLGWLRRSAPVILLVACLALAGCQALGQTPTATGATGVGQYGALSGLQAGSTLLSMSGSVSVQVQPGAGGGALMPPAVRDLIAKIAAETDALLADPNLTPEARKEIVDRSVEMLTRLSAPWGAVTVNVSGVTTGEASSTGSTGTGSGGGSGAMTKDEPEKPKGPAATEKPPATEEPKPTEESPPADTPAKVIEDVKEIIESAKPADAAPEDGKEANE